MEIMFETERLTVRKFRDEDAGKLYENHLDDEVRKWFPNECYADIDEAYTAALLQPVHQKDEFRAFCTIVDRHPVVPGSKNVYIGDRGYCSYNNMAHVIDAATSFDYIEYGSNDTYPISFRVVRVKLSDDSFECFVTNLPAEEFPPKRLKELYYARW